MIVECDSCAAFVEAEIKGVFEYLRKGDGPSGRYVFLQCKKCGLVVPPGWPSNAVLNACIENPPSSLTIDQIALIDI